MIENRIAGTARVLVHAQLQSDTEHKEESAYRSLCEGLPALLRTAGLARTVTFLAAKSDSASEHAAVLQHLDKQLRELGILADAKTALVTWVTSNERKTSEYRHVSTLTFRIVYWHKRLAQALLRKKGVK